MKIIYNSNNTAVNYVNFGNDTLFISFSSYNLPSNIKKSSWNGYQYGFFEKQFVKHKSDYICFVTKENDWYENYDINNAINSVLESGILKRYKRRVVISVSMGAYAASKFCNLLTIDNIILGSPQFSIDHTIIPVETRWKNERESINFVHNNAITEFNTFNGKKTIILDPLHTLDIEQLSLVKTSNIDNVIFQPYSDHMVFAHISKLGLLNSLCEKIFSQKFNWDLQTNELRDFLKQGLIDTDLLFKNLELSDTTDICKEIARLSFIPLNTRLSLIKKAKKNRPTGPEIIKIIKEINSIT